MDLVIKDIILHKNKYYTQVCVIINRLPEFKYEYDNTGAWLLAEDSGFFSFYHQRKETFDQAFCGRPFNIPLVDEGVVKAQGSWWDNTPDDYDMLLYHCGSNTVEQLGKCYVFTSSKIDKQLIDDWLDNHTPSNNYHKYDKRSKEYMKHLIISPWD